MYTIYLNNNPIATVSGAEAAYVCYESAKSIAEMSGQTCSLAWDNEVVDFFDPNEEDPTHENDAWDDDEECLNGDEEMGFDPYEGCYTYDC